MKILNTAKFINGLLKNSVEWMGTKYYYEHRPAEDGEICLATTDPQLYCNGVYTFSSKDPGDGMAFVVMFTDKDDEE